MRVIPFPAGFATALFAAPPGWSSGVIEVGMLPNGGSSAEVCHRRMFVAREVLERR
jgi:hypothetical protein